MKQSIKSLYPPTCSRKFRIYVFFARNFGGEKRKCCWFSGSCNRNILALCSSTQQVPHFPRVAPKSRQGNIDIWGMGVRGKALGQATKASLERANLFLILQHLSPLSADELKVPINHPATCFLKRSSNFAFEILCKVKQNFKIGQSDEKILGLYFIRISLKMQGHQCLQWYKYQMNDLKHLARSWADKWRAYRVQNACCQWPLSTISLVLCKLLPHPSHSLHNQHKMSMLEATL